MEGLELVRLHRRLVLVQVAERVLGAVVVGVVVRVDGLRLQARDRVEPGPKMSNPVNVRI